jgi:hypothetical protein
VCVCELVGNGREIVRRTATGKWRLRANR